jgi:hypothetical protein
MTLGWTIDPPVRGGGRTFLLTAFIFLGGCGGSSKKVTPVDIHVSPAATTIPVNSSVDLLASGSSLVKYTSVFWEVQEEGLKCTTESVPPQPPPVPCPSGWVWEPAPVGELPRTTATYYSPGQPGTYHVVAVAQTADGSNGQVTSTISVTP